LFEGGWGLGWKSFWVEKKLRKTLIFIKLILKFLNFTKIEILNIFEFCVKLKKNI
jgi:hypothetical protein